jgi:hypothetical protein
MTDEMDTTGSLTRRGWLGLVAGGAVLSLVRPLAAAAQQGQKPGAKPAPKSAAQGAALPALAIYKSPSCGCCAKWVDHMKAQGFKVTVHDMDDVSPVKTRMGIPEKLWSCHTGVIGKYAIEGHVPGDVVKRLVKEKPKAIGLAVPGMPMGSPGMEVGGPKDKYDVLLVEAGGRSKVYASR